MKLLGKILLGLVVLVAIAVAYNFYDRPDRLHRIDPEALAALESDQAVAVTQGEYIVFAPADSSPTTGMIFYPGAECDARGYADAMREIAAAGYLAVIVPMPMQMAFFGINKADAVMEAYPAIDNWVIAGHSLGGAMAGSYAASNTDKLAGILLWDTWIASDLSESGLAGRLIHRADEAGNPPEDYGPNLAMNPANTDYKPLPGGSHLNFGRFIAGRMYRDEPDPALPQDEQIELVAQYSVEFLDRVNGGNQNQ